MDTPHKHNFAAIILAAGKGTRMKSALPKVLHRLAGVPMVGHVLAALSPLSPSQSILVTAPDMDAVRDATSAYAPDFATQIEQLGTGHAVKCAMSALKPVDTVLVLYGDTPLITTSTLETLLAEKLRANAAIALLAMEPTDPTGYGRVVLEGTQVTRIVECKDANAEQKKIRAVWGGVMAFDARFLCESLERLTPSPVTREFYLTTLLEMAHAGGLKNIMCMMSVEEAMGVNDRVQLAEAEAVVQRRLREAAMRDGATLIAPETVFLSPDTLLGQDVVVHPHVVFGKGVKVANNVEIKSFSHIEGASIAAGAVVGPVPRIRPESVVGEGAHVGNFVELKNTTLGKGAKANHLSYVGDAEVGAGANIGAGTITCNYDGAKKHKTSIGANAFIGSNSALVAPVAIGEGAVVGAGSVITEDVPAGALGLARGRQVNKAKKKA